MNIKKKGNERENQEIASAWLIHSLIYTSSSHLKSLTCFMIHTKCPEDCVIIGVDHDSDKITVL